MTGLNSYFDTLLQDNRLWTALRVTVFLLGSGWIFLSRVPPVATTSGAPPPSPREGFSAPDFKLDLLGVEKLPFPSCAGKL